MAQEKVYDKDLARRRKYKGHQTSKRARKVGSSRQLAHEESEAEERKGLKKRLKDSHSKRAAQMKKKAKKKRKDKSDEAQRALQRRIGTKMGTGAYNARGTL